MGDISEMRGLVTIVSFIGCLALIMSFIPPQFLIADYEGRTIEPPLYFEAIDLQSYASTWNHTMNETGSMQIVKPLTIGGHVCQFWYHRKTYPPEKKINMLHKWAIIILPQTHWMWFTSSTGIDRGQALGEYELDADYSLNGDLSYTISCSHFSASGFFGFNETLYSSPSEAWTNGELVFLIGVNFDQVGTSYNAWDLIAKLMFFQLPNIHPIVNALIAIPLWVATAYLAYILILRAIGALFGGGA